MTTDTPVTLAALAAFSAVRLCLPGLPPGWLPGGAIAGQHCMPKTGPRWSLVILSQLHLEPSTLTCYHAKRTLTCPHIVQMHIMHCAEDRLHCRISNSHHHRHHLMCLVEIRSQLGTYRRNQLSPGGPIKNCVIL